MDKRIFRLRTRILSDFRHNWTVEEMALTVELSVPYLQKLFKMQTGMSPVAYLREMRLEKARDLLETTFHQINQISYKTGMTDHSHFTRDFKKRYGVTPTEYRNQYWEKMLAEEPEGRE